MGFYHFFQCKSGSVISFWKSLFLNSWSVMFVLNQPNLAKVKIMFLNLKPEKMSFFRLKTFSFKDI